MEGFSDAIKDFIGEDKELEDVCRSMHVEAGGNRATFSSNVPMPMPEDPAAYMERRCNQFAQIKKHMAERGILMELEYEEHTVLSVEGRVVPLLDDADYQNKYIYLIKGPVEVLNEIQRHV